MEGGGEGMRKLTAVLALALGVPGCFDHGALEEHRMASRGLTKDDLEAPPNDNEIRAAITRDVRQNWIPIAELDQGTPKCDGITWEGRKPICAGDQEPMKVFTIWNDSPDKQYPVVETCYFCPKHSIYWYHYQGGGRNRDTWLGPRRLKLGPPKLPE
jgi:hypothetical protein